MDSSAVNLTASVLKSTEVDRSASAAQRAHAAQAQIGREFLTQPEIKRANASEDIKKDAVRREQDRQKKGQHHPGQNRRHGDQTDLDGGSSLDLVA
jgi:hypothetical protein